MSYRVVWYIWQYFFRNLRLAKPIYRVKAEGSAHLSFSDSGHFGKWPPKPPHNLAWHYSSIYLFWYNVHVCQISCFYHKMHDFSLICWASLDNIYCTFGKLFFTLSLPLAVSTGMADISGWKIFFSANTVD